MLKRIKTAIVLAAASLLLMLGLLPAAQTYALDCSAPANVVDQQQCGACAAAGINDNDCGGKSSQSTNSINDLIKKVINIISVIAGIIAVIMLVIGAIRFITSSGNEQGVSAAKKTILYALIGLVIVALAQIIVKFVLTKATQTSSTGTSSQRSGH